MPAGLPYVGWGARPSKNGQPAACAGQCNLNIGARKVGAAMKAYPNLRYGPKAKEQILQKWDPATKSMVNINPHTEFSVSITDFYIIPLTANSGKLNTTFVVKSTSSCDVLTTLFREILNSSNAVIYSDTAKSTDAFSVTIPLTNGMTYRSRISIKTESSKVATSNPYTFIIPSVSIAEITFNDAVGGFSYSFNFSTLGMYAETPLTYMLYSATDTNGTGITPLLGNYQSLPSNTSGSISGTAAAIYGKNNYVIKIHSSSGVLAISPYFVRTPLVFVTSLVIGNEHYDTPGQYSAQFIMKYITVGIGSNNIYYRLCGTNDRNLDNLDEIDYVLYINANNNEQTLSSAFTINSSPTGYLYYVVDIINPDTGIHYYTNLVSPIITVTSLSLVSTMPNDNSLLYNVGYTSTSTARVDFTLYGFQSGDGEVYDDENNSVVDTQTSSSPSGTFYWSFAYNPALNSYYCKFVVNGLTYYSNYSQTFSTPPPQILFSSSGTGVLMSPFSPLSFRFITDAPNTSYITSSNTYNHDNDFQMEYTAYPKIIDAGSNLYIRIQDSDNYIEGRCRGDGAFFIDDSLSRSPYVSSSGTITSFKRIRVTTDPNVSVSFGTTDSSGNNYVNLYTYEFGGAGLPSLGNFTVRFATPDMSLGSDWIGSYLNIVSGTVV